MRALNGCWVAVSRAEFMMLAFIRTFATASGSAAIEYDWISFLYGTGSRFATRCAQDPLFRQLQTASREAPGGNDRNSANLAINAV